MALSSGESEFYAALEASAEALGMMAVMGGFGWHMHGEVHGDASAALGIINRKGLGRTRHIDPGLLWIQQTAAEKRLSYHKVLGSDNPADLMTKYLSVEILEKHSKCIEIEFAGGRANTAPALHNILCTRALWQEEEPKDDAENDPDELLNHLQKAVNEAWVKNWKKHTRKQTKQNHDNHNYNSNDHDDTSQDDKERSGK